MKIHLIETIKNTYKYDVDTVYTLLFYIIEEVLSFKQLCDVYRQVCDYIGETAVAFSLKASVDDMHRIYSRKTVGYFQKLNIDPSFVLRFITSIIESLVDSQIEETYNFFLNILISDSYGRTAREDIALFIDIDGVLNAVGGDIQDKQMDILKEIADSCRKPRLILISYWRENWEKDIQRNTPNGRYIDKMFFKHKMKIHDKTPILHTRNMEISLWLANHPEVKQFIVIDDDGETFTGQIYDNWLQTNTHTGLVKGDVLKAKQILKTTGESGV